MTVKRAGLAAVLVLLASALGWVLFVGLPRWTASPPESSPGSQASTDAAPAAESASRKIHARLFYLASSGTMLQAVERDVEFGESPVQQARRIIEAQLQGAPGLMSAIPPGTKLRNLYMTSDGVAYVDLSADVSSAHPGGSLAEILTVYSVVNALGENLPAVSGVQILIEGREADTLAGHVDLRRPLQKNERWTEGSVETPETPTAARTSGTTATNP